MRNTVLNVVVNCIMKHNLITIVGPTAIGKTALSIKLAKHFNTEIISSDSRQFYKEMAIGTAVPSIEELHTVKHHFIQTLSIKEDYNVGKFEADALNTLDTLFKTYANVIMAGGSGLYVKAVTEGLDEFPDVDPNIRIQLNKQLKNEGIKALQELLKEKDLKGYHTIAIDNPHRLIRALEICIGTGKPYTSFLNTSNKSRSFNTITIGLNADRSILYERINMRVDMMVEAGLLKEAKLLYPFRDYNALNTVGYKELFEHFDGKISLETAISEIKKNTRRFAKRQLTWFRKNDNILWFDYETPLNIIIEAIEQHL